MILGVLAVGNTLNLHGILRQGDHLHYDNIPPPPHIYAVPFTLLFGSHVEKAEREAYPIAMIVNWCPNVKTI